MYLPTAILLVVCLAIPLTGFGEETAAAESTAEKQVEGKSDSKPAPALDMNPGARHEPAAPGPGIQSAPP
jgi:hypothetical protein